MQKTAHKIKKLKMMFVVKIKQTVKNLKFKKIKSNEFLQNCEDQSMQIRNRSLKGPGVFDSPKANV